MPVVIDYRVDWLSVKEMALRLGVAEGVISNMIDNNKLQSKVCDGRIKVRFAQMSFQNWCTTPTVGHVLA